MRLVPADQVPRALSIVFSGISLATIIATPLGSYLGGLVGWRAIFLFTAGLGRLLCCGSFSRFRHAGGRQHAQRRRAVIATD